MKSKVMYKVLFAVLAAALLLAGPAFARGERVGDRLKPFGIDHSFPAGAPFYIWLGWFFNGRIHDVPKYGNFGAVVKIDGEVVSEDFIERTSGGDGYVFWDWVWNFPEGMTGTHTFKASWYAACGYIWELAPELLDGPCGDKHELMFFPVGVEGIVVFE
jgi:hypothetical protein